MYCWGANSSGELGSGDTTPHLTPTAVAGTLTFTTVAAGGAITCGLTAPGTAYCWGWNGLGQLGTGDTVSRLAPTLVAGNVTFAMLSAGPTHACGLTATGVAYCWGYNGDGELATGDTLPRTVPTAVTGGHTYASVNATRFTSCGVTSAGAAFCWGGNQAGQLGNGTNGTGAYSSTPVAVAGGLSFAAVSGSGRHTCGLTSGNVAYCWGRNREGQLGNGVTLNSPVPARVANQP
jgi:alpha-tubulin suppressor-like RCC1 family protein